MILKQLINGWMKGVNQCSEHYEYNTMELIMINLINSKDLHFYLRKLRFENGELLKDMAEKLNMSSSQLSSIEHGKEQPPNDFLKNILSLYKKR